MTVSSTTAKNTYLGNGGFIFSYTFRILAQDQIKVEIKDVNDVITTQVISTDYSVSGVDAQSGGNITFVVAPDVTDTIIFTRNVPLLQQTDYVENDTFPAESHERALDKLTMIDQQIDEETDRTIKVDSAIVGFDTVLPTPEADKFLKYNSAADAIESIALVAGGGIAAVVEDPSPQLGGPLDCNGFNIEFDNGDGITDDSQNEHLLFNKTASAVNHIEVTNAAAAGNPIIASAGDDTNVDLVLATKGTGEVALTGASLKVDDAEGVVDTNGNEHLIFQETASAVNHIEMTNAATANSPIIESIGDDTDVGLDIKCKGTGVARAVAGTGNYEDNISADDDFITKIYYESQAATQAELEAASSTTTFASPGNIKHDPGNVKTRCSCGIAGDINGSNNVSSVTDTGTGQATINFTTSFSDNSYTTSVTLHDSGTLIGTMTTANTGSLLVSSRTTGGTLTDPSVGYNVLIAGDF